SSDGRDERRRAARGADDEMHDVPGRLGVWEIDGRRWFGGQAVVSHVADDADDVSRRLIRPDDGDGASERVPVRAELLHERLIHEHDAWTSDPILRSERASREQRDPHRGKISAADQGAVDRQRARGVEALLSPEAKSRTARPT